MKANPHFRGDFSRQLLLDRPILRLDSVGTARPVLREVAVKAPTVFGKAREGLGSRVRELIQHNFPNQP